MFFAHNFETWIPIIAAKTPEIRIADNINIKSDCEKDFSISWIAAAEPERAFPIE